MIKKVYWCFFIIIVLLFNGFSGCYDKDTVDEKINTGTNTIIIDNFAFEPDELIVDVGTEITWKQGDNVAHNVVFEGFTKSDILNQGDEFSFTFSEKGEYEYICSIHPSMKGKIIVR